MLWHLHNIWDIILYFPLTKFKYYHKKWTDYYLTLGCQRQPKFELYYILELYALLYIFEIMEFIQVILNKFGHFHELQEDPKKKLFGSRNNVA